MTKHLYHLTLRPADIGCYPDRNSAGARIEAEIIESHWPPKRADNRNLYAVIAYAEPLEFDRIWRYDLLPADPVERAHYAFWEYYDRHTLEAMIYEETWLLQPRAVLESMRERGDTMAEYALTILDAEAQP